MSTRLARQAAATQEVRVKRQRRMPAINLPCPPLCRPMRSAYRRLPISDNVRWQPANCSSHRFHSVLLSWNRRAHRRASTAASRASEAGLRQLAFAAETLVHSSVHSATTAQFQARTATRARTACSFRKPSTGRRMAPRARCRCRTESPRQSRPCSADGASRRASARARTGSTSRLSRASGT